MAMTQGVISAMVADITPTAVRGTAYGIFNLASGVAMLAASVVAGALWERFGPVATFDAGAGFTMIALAGLVLLKRRDGDRRGRHGVS